ncbi:MAG: hypothetical protein ACRDZQ_03720, partial [Acidimicrobiales bacterium]
MANAIRDPAPPTWVAAPPPRLSGETGAPLLRGWIHLAALVVTVPAGALLLSRAASTWAVGYVAVYVA